MSKQKRAKKRRCAVPTGSRRFFATNPSIVSDEWLEWEIVECTTYERVCTTNTEKTAREIVAALEYFHANIAGLPRAGNAAKTTPST